MYDKHQGASLMSVLMLFWQPALLLSTYFYFMLLLVILVANKMMMMMSIWLLPTMSTLCCKVTARKVNE